MQAPEKKPAIAIVLPPREAFSPGASGAIGLIARRHASWDRRFAATVLGMQPPLPPFSGVDFLPVRTVWWAGGPMRRYAAGVARWLRGKNPALVEVHNRPDLARVLAKKFPRVPVMLILNNDPRDMRGGRTPADRAALIAGLARIATASGYLGECLLDGVFDPPEQPFVLHNCLDLREVPPPAAERGTKIVFAGRVVGDKGADAFVEACARALPGLPGWRAVMLGGDRFGPDNPDTPFLRALRPRAAAAGIDMLGYRPHAEILAEMSRAAIVVVPSRWPEPFGLVAVEAMACGAALLCSNRGGLAEVTGEAALPINPDDPDGFAAAIRLLATDPGRRESLAAAGLKRARRFDLAAIGPVLDDLRAETIARFSCGARRPI
jgi:glycosyltransferase involved in cell wall biosynthesis